MTRPIDFEHEQDATTLAMRFLRGHEFEAVHTVSLARVLEHTRLTGAKGSSCKLPNAAAYLILDGWLARTVILADGRRQIIEFLLPGDIIGSPPRQTHTGMMQVINLTPARIASVTYDGLHSLRHDQSPIAYGLLEQICRSGDRLADHVLRLGRLGAYERTAHLLLELLFRLERVGLATGGHYPLPVTQEELADALGLSAVHLNRVVRAMTRDRLVDISGRSTRTLITVLDLERMAQIAMYDRDQDSQSRSGLRTMPGGDSGAL